MNKVTTIMTKCIQCRDLDHTGAFTKNGAVSCCRNNNAPKDYCMSEHAGEWKDKNYFIAKIDNANEIPDWCPLLAN